MKDSSGLKADDIKDEKMEHQEGTQQEESYDDFISMTGNDGPTNIINIMP